MCLLAFFFFSGRIRLPDDNFQIQLLHYYWLPVITVMAGAYLIAQGFFSVYSMCVDSLFLCFLEDLERNEGTMLRPYYMSGSLWRILNKS
ncbi:choline transporter-like protein 4 [Electrophorus electricus]|uniref:choline transporter-like protein 4 n=1 Tax=Electrophorus electricus TaxID=8005 RepID=UPI0015D008C3|nr:choline transporter-like protein 4 [Electrophorus electricus]